MRLFDKYLSELPERYEDYKGHLERLAREPIADNEAELYPILQAGAFGGRQVSRYGDKWSTEGFISYGNVRHYTPRPKEMRKRICALIEGMIGVTCYHEDVNNLLNMKLPDKAVVYLDPPYAGMKGYKFKLDVHNFVNNFVNKFIVGKRHLWVSEGYVLDDCGCKGFKVTQLFAKGLVGNVNGSRDKEPHKEYLNHYYAV